MDRHKISELKDILQRHSLFSFWSNEIIEEVIRKSQVKFFQPNQVILQEGSVTEQALYLLLEGRAERIKYDNKGNKIVINEILAEEVFGEGIMFDEQTRAISVHALSPVKVLVIAKELVNTLCDKKTFSQLLCKLYADMDSKLIALLDLQKNVGLFLINIVVLLSLFSILAPTLQSLIKTIDALWVTLVIITAGVIFLVSRLLVRKIPLSFIGITRKNLKRSLIEAVFISFIVIALGLMLKIVLIRYTPFFPNGRIFNTAQQRELLQQGMIRSNIEVVLVTLTYCVHSFLQEILARGSMQTTFKYFFTFKYKNFSAIVLASLVFAAAHSFFGINTVLTVFFLGLLWGWMYERQGNIFGAGLSHALIGACFVQFIGPL